MRMGKATAEMRREQRTVSLAALESSKLSNGSERSLSVSARPRSELGSHGSWAYALACLKACSNALAVVDQGDVEIDRMLRPAAEEVAAAASRKSLIHPHEAGNGSPATGWKSQHAGTGKALWIRLGGARAAVVSEWAVRDGLAGRTC